MENMEIYNRVKTVPDNAKKKIVGGRISGMTDIKPMWRIEKLTEIFGPAGLGWYTKILKEEIIEGANNEKIAQVDIELYVNYKIPFGTEKDMWSHGIFGTGGSSFIANESKGLYTNDECMKMAYTDALSVACKSLGVGADVYWGDSKYKDAEEEIKIETKEQAENLVLTFGKHKGKKLKEVDESYKDYLLKKAESELVKHAIRILRGPDNPKEENIKADFMLEINRLELETDTAHEEILAYFKVNSNADMTIDQLKECIGILQRKQQKQQRDASVSPYDF